MRALYACANDVPPDMLRKVELLHVKEKKIVELEAQIEVLRNECDIIRLEMSRYLVLEDVASSTGPLYTKTGAPINRCPDEILSNIFSLYLIDHHISIRRLLLVCKRWYQLVINSHRMWARIQVLDIRPFIQWSDKETQAKPYIDACMRRSNGLPMDVELDLSRLHLNAPECLHQLVKFSTHWITQYVLEDQYDQLERTYDVDDDESNLEGYLEGYVESALQDLTRPCCCRNRGSNVAVDKGSVINHCGSYDHRWSTLSIALPNSRVVSNLIWERIGKVTAKLDTIEIQEHADNWIQRPRDPEPSFPDFSAVKSLTIPLGRSIHRFNVSSALLRYLDIEFYAELIVLEQLSTFEHLETLRLRGTQRAMYPETRFKIHLPELKELECSGHYSLLTWLDLDFPRLAKLVMSGHPRHHAIPGISPRCLKWVDPFVGFSDVIRDLHPIEPFPLKSIISAYPAVQTFTIPARLKQTVAAMLSKVKVPHAHINWLEEDDIGEVQSLDISNVAFAPEDVDYMSDSTSDSTTSSL